MKRAQRFGWLWLGLLVLATLGLSACGGGGGGSSTPATPAPVLSISPLSLDFSGVAGGANPANQTVTITNSGNASLTSWGVSSNQSWLTASPTSGGPLAASSSATVTVSINTASLAAGTHNGLLTISGSGLASKTVAVALTLSTLNVAPHITLDLNSVGFTTADQTPRTIVLTNQNNTSNVNQTMNWQVANLVMGAGTTWFTVSPLTAQTLGAGAQTNLTVTLDTTGYAALSPGTYNGTFQITSADADNSPQTVNVQLVKAAPAVATLSTSPASLTFTATTGGNPSPDTKSVTITNAGTANLDWSANLTFNSGGNTWGSFTSATSGTLTPGNSTTLSFKVVSSGLAAGTYNGTIDIGGNGGTASIPVTLTVSAAAAAASTTSIGGRVSVTQLSSLVASPRARRAAVTQGSDASLLTDADVVVTVLHNGGKREYRTQTDSNGNYTVNADIVSGDTVTVNISKAGYVPYIQTIEVTDQNKNSVFNVTGTVAPTNTVVVPKGGALKASGGTTPGFRFGLVRNRNDGALKAFRSSSDLQGIRAADTLPRNNPDSPFIDVNIPASRLGGSVTTLTAEMAGFNPADPEDRSMFPGEFKGIGGGSATIAKADTTEYPLESIAFMQLDVKQDDGKDLQIQTPPAGSAQRAAADPVTITKWIPREGCGQMQKYQDRDTLKPGVQVPLYTYNPNTGKWIYLGEGTIKVWNGNSYDVVPEGDIVEPLNGSKLSGLACGTTDYYFEIVVDTEWYTWWNLDYPLITDISNQKIVHGRVTYDDGTPASGVYVYAYADGGSYYYGYTDVDGNYSFDVFYDDVTTLAPLSSVENFKAYNYKTWREQSPTAVPSAANNFTADFVFTNPYTCKAQGRVLRDNNPIANDYVYAWGSTSGYWDYAQTGSDGRFSLSTPCGESITLWSNYQERTFIVNNLVGPAEQSDNGRVSVLKDMVLINQPPQVYLSAWPTDVTAGNQVELYGWAWDPEYTPVTYAWSMSPAAKTLTGSDYVVLDTSGMSGEYVITLSGTDADGKTGSAQVTITVTPPAANKPPVLMDFNYYLDTWTSGDVCNPSVVFWSSAFDPEGQALTYQWGAPSGSFAEIPGGWGEYSWTGATTSAQQVSLTVSDGLASSKTLSKIVTPPTAPTPQVWWVDAWPNPLAVNESIYLSAYGWVENGANLTYAWTLTDPNSAPVTLSGNGPNLEYIPSVAGTYNGTVTATACGRQSTVYNFSFTVNALAGNTPPEIWYAAGYPSGATTVELYAYGWDEDWDVLSYAWSDGGAGGSFNYYGGDGSYVTWTAPVAGFAGTVNFTLAVSDLDATQTIKSTTNYGGTVDIAVDTSNVPKPEVYDVWTEKWPVYASGGGTLLYAYAMDPTGTGLTYTWADTTEPSSLPATGSEPFWNPTVVGDHTITVTVSDGSQTSLLKSFIINVAGKPAGTEIVIQ